jgi:hypothetical protein
MLVHCLVLFIFLLQNLPIQPSPLGCIVPTSYPQLNSSSVHLDMHKLAPVSLLQLCYIDSVLELLEAPVYMSDTGEKIGVQWDCTSAIYRFQESP